MKHRAQAPGLIAPKVHGVSAREPLRRILLQTSNGALVGRLTLLWSEACASPGLRTYLGLGLALRSFAPICAAGLLGILLQTWQLPRHSLFSTLCMATLAFVVVVGQSGMPFVWSGGTDMLVRRANAVSLRDATRALLAIRDVSIYSSTQGSQDLAAVRGHLSGGKAGGDVLAGACDMAARLAQLATAAAVIAGQSLLACAASVLAWAVLWVLSTREHHRPAAAARGVPRAQAELMGSQMFVRDHVAELKIFGSMEYFAQEYLSRLHVCQQEEFHQQRDRIRRVLRAAVVVLILWMAQLSACRILTTRPGGFFICLLASGYAAAAIKGGGMRSSAARGLIAVEALVRLEAAAASAGAQEQICPRPGSSAPAVQIHGLSVATHSGDRVLQDIDMEIGYGQTVALIGPSGSGKTTLLNVVAGLLRPTQGTVLVAGVQPWAGTSSHLAVQSQRSLRIRRSLRAAVAHGQADVSDDAVFAAIRAVGADHLAPCPTSLSRCLDPQEPHGEDLSGGEWQKIEAARTRLQTRRGAWLALLDEPTSALDPISEARVIASWQTLGMVRIVATHRRAAALSADWICVLRNGRIAWQGPRAEFAHVEPTVASGVFC